MDKPLNMNLSSLERELRASSGQACKKRAIWFVFSVVGLSELNFDCLHWFFFVCLLFFLILFDFYLNK